VEPEIPYDELGPADQAVRRHEWSRQISERIDQVNLAELFGAEGRSYVELDEEGCIVTRHPDGTSVRSNSRP
jgi:hypothetical protein